VTAINPTDQVTGQHNVLRHDRLLAATAKATNVLLTMEDLEPSVSKALGIIGEGIGCDLVLVLENIYEMESPQPNQLPSSCDLIYAWASPDFQTLPADFNPSMPAEFLGLDFLEQYFLAGNGFGGPVDHWDEPLRSWLVSMQIASAYAVPIRVKGEFWGALCLDYRRANIEISPAEVSVLMTIADCIGSAIQRDRTQKLILQTAQERAAELAKANVAMRHSIDWLARDPNINTFWEHWIQEIVAQFDAVHAQLFLYDPSDRTLSTPVAFMEGKIMFFPPFTSKFSVETWCGWDILLQSPKPRSVSLETESHTFLPEYLEYHRKHKIRGIVCSMLWQNEQPLGFIGFGCRNRDTFSENELELVQSLAQQATLAIQLTRLAEKSKQAAIAREQEQAAQERAAELTKTNEALRRAIAGLVRLDNLDQFLAEILKISMEVSGAQSGTIALIEGELVRFAVLFDKTGQVSSETQAEQGTLSMPFSPEVHHLAQQTLQYEEAWTLHLDDPVHSPGFRAFHREQGTRAIRLVPMQIGDQLLGWLGLGFTQTDPPLGKSCALLRVLAEQMTMAVRILRLAEEAKQAALLQERTALAREIHDTLAQAFGGILMQLQAATYFSTTQPEQAQTHLLTAQKLAQEGLAEARRSVWTLQRETVEYEDLTQAIAKFIQQAPADPTIDIRLSTEGTPYRLHPEQGLNLLRMAQEAVTNALRHAQTQTVEIHLSYAPQMIKLMIWDHGRGFDLQLPTQGFGLLGMQQRATRIGADWQLVSQLGQGTTITIMLDAPQSPDPL
jgi:signal transduction histidine kinase